MSTSSMACHVCAPLLLAPSSPLLLCPLLLSSLSCRYGASLHLPSCIRGARHHIHILDPNTFEGPLDSFLIKIESSSSLSAAPFLACGFLSSSLSNADFNTRFFSLRGILGHNCHDESHEVFSPAVLRSRASYPLSSLSVRLLPYLGGKITPPLSHSRSFACLSRT